ncbi:hypothetical protein CI102_8737 [Trichoderma harzianum]|nr:hypothetical protein CI102_8737 [Trichoderma harzianum]
MINCSRPPECSLAGNAVGKRKLLLLFVSGTLTSIIGGVDMLVLAELRQSGSLPCLWRYLERLELAGASLWQPRWGGRRNVMAGPGPRYVLYVPKSVIT